MIFLYDPRSRNLVQVENSYLIDSDKLQKGDFESLINGYPEAVEAKYLLSPGDFAVVKSILASKLRKS